MDDQSSFYNRISQIGEYKYDSSLNAIFVFQLTFIVLLSCIVLYYLNISGFLSTPTLWLLIIIISLLLGLIYINRFYVLPKMRDQNDYNRFNYGDNTLKPTQPITNGGKKGGDTGPPPTTTTCANTGQLVQTYEQVCTQDPSIY